jgi:hypothetical protein
VQLIELTQYRQLSPVAAHWAGAPLASSAAEITKARVGKHRGAAVARIDLARRLTEAIWYMLTRHQAFAPAGPW